MMFDKLKAMGAVAGLMKNQEGLKAAAARVREQMEQTRVTGEAGSGAARATVTGTLKVISVELSPALVGGMNADERTRQLASSLIADAINDAMKHAHVKIKEAIDAEAKALGLEGMIPDLASFMGGR
jgi:nucleoid-associated protein EbfC